MTSAPFALQENISGERSSLFGMLPPERSINDDPQAPECSINDDSHRSTFAVSRLSAVKRKTGLTAFMMER
jgi:hypothetical protein